jgi:outer membrane lipoprotein SlyB
MTVQTRLLPALLAVLLTALLTACTSVPIAPFSGAGTVQSIREIREPSTLATLTGAIGGAALGGALGANIGSGSGQVAAASMLSVASGTLGAMAARLLGSRTRYEVWARFEDGIDRAYLLDTAPPFRPGDRVRVLDGRLEGPVR